MFSSILLLLDLILILSLCKKTFEVTLLFPGSLVFFQQTAGCGQVTAVVTVTRPGSTSSASASHAPNNISASTITAAPAVTELSNTEVTCWTPCGVPAPGSLWPPVDDWVNCQLQSHGCRHSKGEEEEEAATVNKCDTGVCGQSHINVSLPRTLTECVSCTPLTVLLLVTLRHRTKSII